jgi:hypothetical protein
MYARFSTQATKTFLMPTILSHIAKSGAAASGFAGAGF